MTLPKVRSVSESNAEHAIAALTLAFSTDPVIRAFYPDPLEHLTHFPEMMRLHIAPAIAHQAAHFVEGFSAAAIWFPPKSPGDDPEPDKDLARRLGTLIEETASREGNDDLFAAISEMDKLHPKEPHWYLFAIGVDPDHQNEGLGSILMEHALPKCDAGGTLAYLESSSPRNVPFYQRHGFEVLQVVQVGSSPTFTLMVREPR
jgi:GNAT superfamily N-acetyltransferase